MIDFVFLSRITNQMREFVYCYPPVAAVYLSHKQYFSQNLRILGRKIDIVIHPVCCFMMMHYNFVIVIYCNNKYKPYLNYFIYLLIKVFNLVYFIRNYEVELFINLIIKV